MSIQTLSERYPKTAFCISISLCSFFSYIDWFLLLSFSFSVSVGNCKGWLWSTYWHWLLFLSHLHGNAVFEQVTKNAVRGLWARRSKLNLVGAHINVFTGEWTQKVTFFFLKHFKVCRRSRVFKITCIWQQHGNLLDIFF